MMHRKRPPKPIDSISALIFGCLLVSGLPVLGYAAHDIHFSYSRVGECDALFGTRSKNVKLEASVMYSGGGAEDWLAFFEGSQNMARESELQMLDEILLDAVSSKEKLNLVDIGVGTGHKAYEILQILGAKANRFWGVDISQSLLDGSRSFLSQKLGSRVPMNFHLNDFEQAPLNEIKVHDSVYLLLGQTLGNQNNRAEFLEHIRESMGKESLLIVGVDLYVAAKVPSLLESYSSEWATTMDMNALGRAGLVPEDGEMRVRFDVDRMDFVEEFVLKRPVLLEARERGSGRSQVLHLLPNDVIEVFSSHRFFEPELRSLFRSAGFDLIQMHNLLGHDQVLIVAKPL